MKRKVFPYPFMLPKRGAARTLAHARAFSRLGPMTQRKSPMEDGRVTKNASTTPENRQQEARSEMKVYMTWLAERRQKSPKDVR